MIDGLNALPLHQFGTETAALGRWRSGTQFNRRTYHGGEENYVVKGVFEDEYGAYLAGTWIRSPHRSAHTPFSNEGCLIYFKTGHFLGEYGTLSNPAERAENSTVSIA